MARLHGATSQQVFRFIPLWFGPLRCVSSYDARAGCREDMTGEHLAKMSDVQKNGPFSRAVFALLEFELGHRLELILCSIVDHVIGIPIFIGCPSGCGRRTPSGGPHGAV